jgi:hypothetical protein
MVYNGQLIGTDWAYFSGANEQATSHFVLDSLNLSTAGVHGLYAVGNTGRVAAGYMTSIPAEWQAALGATALTGQSDVPIISTVSSGPAAIGFNPADFGSGAASASTYLYYPVNNPLGPFSDVFDPLQSGPTSVTGAAFLPHTSSVLFFGKTGANYNSYGVGSDFGDYVYPGDKGPHTLNGQYALQVWAYNANDFVAVKQGTMQPYQVMPYDVWDFTLPISNSQVGGVTFDAATGRLYVAVTSADAGLPYSSLPLIEVFQLNMNPSGVTGAPEVGTLAVTPVTMAPGPVASGTNIILTAGNVYAIADGASVTQVAFYLDTGGPSHGQLLGYGTQSSVANNDHTWQTTVSTAGLAPGTYTITVVAQDSNGLFSDPISTTFTIV